MGFSRQEYQSGLPCPPPGDRPNPGMEPVSLMSFAFAGRFFTTNHPRSVQFSHSVVSDSLPPHGLQHARLPCPSPTPELAQIHVHQVGDNSPSVVPFSSCLQSFPASGSFPMSKFFTSDGQIIGVSASASVFPMNIQD